LECAMDDVVETERLLLRPLRLSDAEAIAEKINNFDISKNLARVPFPYTMADAEEFLDWALALDQRSAFRVISLRSGTSGLIGLISYDWVEARQNAELGYWLVQPHWGKGLMTEAAIAMVDHAFSNAAINVLSSCYFEENPASGHVLRKAGFVAGGPCTHFSRSRNAEVPVITMRLDRQTWAHKKAAL
jgi:RimJ/RimL family protein N-acetyltransferase